MKTIRDDISQIIGFFYKSAPFGEIFDELSSNGKFDSKIKGLILAEVCDHIEALEKYLTEQVASNAKK